MKKGILFFLSIGFLLLSVSAVHALNYDDWIDSITTAGDALIAAQNSDGSFDWVNDGDPNNSGSPNIQGATARGLVAAYNVTGNTAYLNAANKNADWIKNNLPTGSMYNKDIEFLYELAAAGGNDYTAQASASAIAYVNNKISQTGESTGADAIYSRYKNSAWVASAGTLDGLKYWMIGEWGDVGRLLGDTEIFTGYSGYDMAKGIGTLMANDFAIYTSDLSVDPYESYSTLGIVGILEGLDAGIDSGGFYSNTQTVIDFLSGRVENGTGTDGWQSLGYATYALSLFDASSSLTGRDNLAAWIDGGYFDTGVGSYPESMGEALLGLSSAAAPVPEPATVLLFGIGLLGIAGVSRKKK